MVTSVEIFSATSATVVVMVASMVTSASVMTSSWVMPVYTTSCIIIPR